MKIPALLVCLLAAPVAAAPAPQAYRCLHVTQSAAGGPVLDRAQFVELALADGAIHSRIHVNSASRDGTFETCQKTAGDSSNFHRWFETECHKLVGIDTKGIAVDVFMVGAYAGISPPIEPGYSMYDTLAQAGAQLGLGTPARTFVIYSERKPQYEFFCYPAAGVAK